MFIALLGVTLLVSMAVSIVVVRSFSKPLDSILRRIIADEISSAWLRYLKFAIIVVGVSAGVRIHELEKYITPWRGDQEQRIVQLTNDRWVLELYRMAPSFRLVSFQDELTLLPRHLDFGLSLHTKIQFQST